MTSVPPETQRLFIAISIPEKVKVEIEKVQDILRRAMPIGAVRWTKTDQFHLTLKFFGSVPVDKTDALVQAMTDVCKDFPPLKLRAERIGFFPNENKPRLVWVGVNDLKNTLAKIQRAIETAAKEFTKEPPEKNFTGHMTLGRSKDIDRKNAELLRKAAGGYAKRFFGAWTAEGVEVFRSDLSAGGSQYHKLASIPFGAKPTTAEETGPE